MFATLPTNAENYSASRILLSFWERAAFSPALDHGYKTHLLAWREGLLFYLQQAREDGDVVTPVSNEQLVDELVTINVGSTLLHALGPDHVNATHLHSHVEALLDRIRRP